VTAGTPFKGLCALIGFTASLAQILLLRELIVVFDGNELSLGLMLAIWLFWTAAGSAAAGWYCRKTRPARFTALLQILLALALPLTVLAIRAMPAFLASVPGQSLGPGAMLLGSFSAMSAVCLLSGGLFAAASASLVHDRNSAPALASGTVYVFEALGSAAGGLLAATLLIPNLGPLQIALVLSLLNLISASLLVIGGLTRRILAAAILLASFAAFFIPILAPALERASLSRFWPGSRLVDSRTSNYGRLDLLETGQIRSLYENGLPLFHVPDPAAAEEAVHYALLQHPAPGTLLLLGGGLNGAIAEALKHPTLRHIDYAELDPAILQLAASHFPRQWATIASDPRVRVHAADGRRLLHTASAPFDVIVVNAPAPRTAQLNRFYTAEFFRQAAGRLSPGGVLSFQLTASENYISPELAAFLRSIRATLRTDFPCVALMPGDTVHFFASRPPCRLAATAADLLARLRARAVQTEYVREYYLPFRMSPGRVAALEIQTRPEAATPVNRDFAPISYYFSINLWSGRFSRAYSVVLTALSAVRFPVVAAATAATLFLLLLPGRRRPRAAAAACAASTGFVLLGLQVLILLAYQAVYGAVYLKLAVLFAAFMAGMALGGALALRPFFPRSVRALAVAQAALALTPFALCGVFKLIPSLSPAIGEPLFFVSAMIPGLFGGLLFPLASHLYLLPGKPNLGALYALDLAGSCLAAILFSAWLIPVFGFTPAALLLALVGLLPAASSAFALRGQPDPSHPGFE
jgi:spermidine synthase